MENYVVAALYKFVELPDYEQLRLPLHNFCEENQIKGTLLLAYEGINGTIAGERENLERVLAFLRSDPRFADLEHKESIASKRPFRRMKVKLKKEIVTLGVEGINPSLHVGKYVEPQDWNALISDPNTLVIDTRNTYEVDIGTFKNAIDPKTTTFRELPNFVKQNLSEQDKNKKIAMFCTGGIRCEKSTAFLMQQGFKDVYHLKGGILKYLETVSSEDSLWEGDCFVFDERVAVAHDLSQSGYDQCHGCRHPISAEDRQSPQYKPGIHCPHCYEHLTERKLERSAERQKQIELARSRNEEHLR
jgi:UPF0176 protein